MVEKIARASKSHKRSKGHDHSPSLTRFLFLWIILCNDECQDLFRPVLKYYSQQQTSFKLKSEVRCGHHICPSAFLFSAFGAKSKDINVVYAVCCLDLTVGQVTIVCMDDILAIYLVCKV